MGTIRVGIGGWTFEPWRGVFFPEGLRQKDEMAYAISQLTSIEINGTYYRLQSAKSFAAWAAAAPDGFQYAVKASRYCTNRKVLAEAEESIGKFVSQGLAEMGDRLGPIVWQFANTKQFDPDDFGAFLNLLPDTLEGMTLRHALEVRHESFVDPAFYALARKKGAAIVFADHPTYPRIEQDTADFTYARLMQTREEVKTGYDAGELDGWAETAKTWAAKGDAFVYMISGAKVRAPAAAMALIDRVGR